MKRKSHVFRGLASIFLALLVIMQIVASVATAWSGKVNELLGISDASIERSDNPEDYQYRSDFETPSDLIQAEIDLNTRLAAEGSVVLKGTPKLDGSKVTLFGMRSGGRMQFGGSMGELTDASNIVSLADAMTENGFSVNPDMEQFYKNKEAEYAPSRTSGGNVVSSYEDQGSAVGEVPVSKYTPDDIGEYKDAAVVVFGRDAGESCCFYPGVNGLSNPDEFTDSPTGNILSLSNDERDLLNYVKEQGFGKIVVLLNVSSAMEIEELKTDDAIDSIIWIGNPGAYGTYGIAKLLSGEMLPSGHLTDTFAVNSALSPAAQNYGIYTFDNAENIETTDNHALRNEWYLVEAEGIYTGYKYYETRYFDSVAKQGNAATALKGETVNGSRIWNYDNEVSYSFGYGIEGSTFTEEIKDVDMDWSGDADSTVTVEVTNTGSQAAKHAVQLYVSLPYTENDRKGGVEKSAIQLIGYAKTGEAQEKTYADVVLLEPGASEEVTITFNAQDLYSYDTNYAHDGVNGAYVLEAGDYYFATGNGAHDAVQAVLKEIYPDQTNELAPSGTVYAEKLSTDTYLTEANDVTIQNQLDGADLNKLGTDVAVTYLTRNDWANTFPESVDSLTATEDMIYTLRNATYNAELEASLYDGPTEFTYGADNGIRAIDLVGLDYDDSKYEQILDEMTLEDLVNQYNASLEELQNIMMPKENPSDSPLGLIATIGQRSKESIYEVSEEDNAFGYHTNAYVGAPVVAATFSPFLQEEEGRLLANDALWTGYSTWFGPGMNLHRTPYNGRNVGYYSEDSVLTGMTATYVHRGLNAKGVVTNAKHFAFNDQETNRDGLAVFLSEQAARENELRGFQIPIRDGSLKGLMSAFNRVGCVHVAAHTGLMNGILRGEWGFRGYMITDSVKSSQYFLPKECLMAGNDMMLGGSNNGKIWEFTEETVAKDLVLQAALRESYHRKLYFYTNSVLMNGITQASSTGNSIVWWTLMLRILGGITFVGFVVFFVLFLVNVKKERRA
jgi:beta-glucosidase